MADSENRVFELKVGIFIAVGILIFFIVVFSIGDVYLVRGGYHIKAVFNFANGITESSPVRFAGVNVGQVDEIRIFFDQKEKKTKVELLAWINSNDIRITRDSVAVINTLGLLGEKYLEIFPGSDINDLLYNGGTIIGEDPIPTERIARRIDHLIETADTIATRLEKGDGTIGKFLTDDKIYDDIEAFVEDIKKHPWKLLHKPRGER